MRRARGRERNRVCERENGNNRGLAIVIVVENVKNGCMIAQWWDMDFWVVQIFSGFYLNWKIESILKLITFIWFACIKVTHTHIENHWSSNKPGAAYEWNITEMNGKSHCQKPKTQFGHNLEMVKMGCFPFINVETMFVYAFIIRWLKLAFCLRPIQTHTWGKERKSAGNSTFPWSVMRRNRFFMRFCANNFVLKIC